VKESCASEEKNIAPSFSQGRRLDYYWMDGRVCGIAIKRDALANGDIDAHISADPHPSANKDTYTIANGNARTNGNANARAGGHDRANSDPTTRIYGDISAHTHARAGPHPHPDEHACPDGNAVGRSALARRSAGALSTDGTEHRLGRPA
jgi:hypothetical protein